MHSSADQCPYLNKANPAWAQCFGKDYRCEECCLTGYNKFGHSCWDTSPQSRDRCCTNALPATNFQQRADLETALGLRCDGSRRFVGGHEASSVSDTCAADNACFDSLYMCEPCCSTGVASSGIPCWDHYYTKKRCCNSAKMREARRDCACGPLGYQVRSCVQWTVNVGLQVK